MLSALDHALLQGVDAVITHYEPVIAIMAQTRATQERPTLNDADLRQLGRMVVKRCFDSLDRDPDVRSFDALVKSSIRKRLLTELGKEFCVSRGRFVIEHFSEAITDDNETTTPPHAQTAYRDYHEQTHHQFNFDILVSDIRELLPTQYHTVFDTILEHEGISFQNLPAKRLASIVGMSINDFMATLNNIQVILQPYRDELFTKYTRPI